jgi:hypothetical protein
VGHAVVPVQLFEGLFLYPHLRLLSASDGP